MSKHQVHVFISHAWAHSGHYSKISDWIFGENHRFGQASVDFRNYSIPKDDPVHDVSTDRELQNAINNRISRCHVIVIPTGMYANYSKWIQKEIVSSKGFSKPILAVNPWAQQRSSSVVVDSSTDQCGWQKASVVGKVWKLYQDNF